MPVSWLDELLFGGIHVPQDAEGPLLVALSGPPGIGKSLMVQQICFALAERAPKRQARSVYATTETSPSLIVENLRSLGYESSDASGSVLYAALTMPPPTVLPPMLIVDGRPAQVDAADAFEQALNKIMQWQTFATTRRANAEYALANIAEPPSPESHHTSERRLDVLVIDSLNVFLDQSRVSPARVVSGIRSMPNTPRIVVVIMDALGSDTSNDRAQALEYLADLVVRFGSTYARHDYLVRHIEIAKCRFQRHAFGRHLVKIIPALTPQQIEKSRKRAILDPPEALGELDVDPDGPRPFARRGGVFVIPSLHYILSRLARREPLIQQATPATGIGTSVGGSKVSAWSGKHNRPWEPWGASLGATDSTETLSWPSKGLFELAGGGIRRGKCVALVGPRGPRRGYLAYQFVINGAQLGERTLILSFRDDAQEVRSVLKTIAEHMDASTALSRFPPVVLFQRPGFVTAEEVFHRLVAVVGQIGPSRIMINAIDQWEATHPFLSETEVFIPTVLDFLEVQQITGVVSCVRSRESSVPVDALLAEAGLILEFEYVDLFAPPSGWERKKCARLSNGLAMDDWMEGVPLLTHGRTDRRRRQVVVRPIRVPAAVGGLRRAIMRRVDTAGKKELEFVPLAPEFAIGE